VRRLLATFAVLAVVLLPGCGGDDEGGGREAVRRVTLALDFSPNAAHAGIYAAVRERLDRRHGVALRVREPAASTDSLKLLAAGRSDVSVVDIHDLGLARERGADVVGVGALVQRPLAAVIARAGINRPRALAGRRVGVTGLPSDDAVLRAVLEADGAELGSVRRTTIGFSAVPSLVARKVDAVVAFWNVEGVALRRRGVRTREFRVERYGAPRYPELVLVTTERTLRTRRALLSDTLAALRDGTEAALADPSAIASELSQASGADPELVRAELREIGPALRPALRLNRAALEGWARFDARFGILRDPPDVDEAFPTTAR
jgi:putative hydroxymethylpyrimidine transport system substrate-binding protein